MQKALINNRAADLKSAGLVHLATLLIKRADQRLQTQAGLTYSQLKVLLIVEGKHPVTQRDLAECLDLTEAAVSRLTETLVKKKFLVRTTDPRNRRANHLRLTETGRAVIDSAFAMITSLETDLYSDLKVTELAAWQKTTLHLLQKLLSISGC